MEIGRKAFEMKNKGYSFRKIALEIGKSPETIRREYKRYLLLWEMLENGTFPIKINNKPTKEYLEELRKISFENRKG